MKISTKYSRAIFDDAMSALKDKSHPCRPMVEWQKNNNFKPIQLPEPFSGYEAKLKIAFIGLNPSATPNEVIPTSSDEWPFEKYDRFYRSRFGKKQRDSKEKLFVNFLNGSKKKVRLWNNIEIFGNQYLKNLTQENFYLGKDALLIEAVRYKTKKGWLGNNSFEKRKIIEHQTKFTQMLIEENIFSILVPMGNDALRQMNNIIKFSKQLPNTISEAMGKSFIGETYVGSTVVVCPIKHMSYPPSSSIKKAVANQIMQAYEKIN